MKEFEIHTATLEDASAIARLMIQLGYPTSEVEMRERMRPLLTHPDYHTLVAEHSADVVGMVGICIGYFYERNGTYGRILALVVDNKFRGQAIGKTLLEHAEQWLINVGVQLIVVNSGYTREAAHRFYTRMGYADTGLRFVKAI